MKFGETMLRTSLKIWMGIIIISSTFYVSFLGRITYEYWQMKSVSLLFVVIHLLAGVIGSVCYEVITSLHLL